MWPLWTTEISGNGRAQKGWEWATSTSDSVAIRVWPMAWLPSKPAKGDERSTSFASPTSFTISIERPIEKTSTCGSASTWSVRSPRSPS